MSSPAKDVKAKGWCIKAYNEQRRGSYRPLARSEIVEKFHTTAGRILSPASIQKRQDVVMFLKHMPDIQQIKSLLSDIAG